MDETVLFDLSYGMYIIGTVKNTKPVGCIVNTVVQITNEPNTLAVSINKNNYTYKAIEQTKRFSISILSTQTPPGIIGTFGFYSSEDTDKFSDYSYEIKDNMPVIKEKCCGTIFCELLSASDRGTHMVLFAKIVDTIRLEQLEPMTYSYYHNVIKGKTAENAPTYRKKKEEKPAPKKNISYRCIVCGYVYEGDLMQEPDTYKCPICGVGKDKFVLQETE